MGEVSTYVVDLSSPPKLRWVHLIRDRREDVMRVHKSILEVVEERCPWLVRWLGPWTVWLCKGKMRYYEEIEGIAQELDVPVTDVVLCQIAFELFACSTNIVVLPGHHIRTMDWPLESLKDITVNVNFVRDRHIVANVTTWVGYVGVLTGMTQHFSCSVNLESDATIAGNAWEMLGRQRWPVGYLVRDALIDRANTTYAETLQRFCKAPLISSAHICMCAFTRADIVSRTRNGVTEHRTIEEPGQYLVQTNVDVLGQSTHDILFKDSSASTMLVEANEPASWQVLQRITKRWPCFNDIHIYTTEMGPGQEHFRTVV